MLDRFFEGSIHRIADNARNSSTLQVFLASPASSFSGRLMCMEMKDKTRHDAAQPYDVELFGARLEAKIQGRGGPVGLARACGVEHSAVQGWLKGSIPRHKYWHQIENFLSCSMAYLLFGIGEGAMPSDKSLDRQAAMAVLLQMERDFAILKTIVRKPATQKRNPPGPAPRPKKKP